MSAAAESTDQQSGHLVIGHFRYVDEARAAIADLRAKGLGLKEIEVFSPIPNHDLEDELYEGMIPSPVRRVVLAGAVSGCLLAFLMCCWMSMDWPMRTSAKTVLSIPAFVVIGFECTILIGGISTLLAMFHFSKLPNLAPSPAFRPNFTEGDFGVTVKVSKDQTSAWQEAFKRRGAHHVEVQYAR